MSLRGQQCGVWAGIAGEALGNQSVQGGFLERRVGWACVEFGGSRRRAQRLPWEILKMSLEDGQAHLGLTPSSHQASSDECFQKN